MVQNNGLIYKTREDFRHKLTTAALPVVAWIEQQHTAKNAEL